MNQSLRQFPRMQARNLVLLAGLTLGSGMTLMAQTAPNPQGSANGNKHTQLDHDGKTSNPQAAQQLSFQRADANNDGVLSREEAQNLPAISSSFGDWDKDGDGKISQKEFVNQSKESSSTGAGNRSGTGAGNTGSGTRN
jgi:hypothetical protein